ncbi:fumarylacetoacetate hydrolase family protein [Acaricomes phytoseiuli]|uniref:fumarylacetoacetate hydrolase family protein n=1 Tax=Acaricomes phytoseiuli TaxID=291968 RepID=UPI00036D1791|nr:fumarylacetoacetate hydrolase family protein [Acaricomes phytoseiuli]MCW1250021.1 fumarylacetoacetate hydrolase family protein [Acaricomes phytoseiuli]
MKLATIRRSGSTAAAVLRGDQLVEIEDAQDVGELLGDPAWARRAAEAAGTAYTASGADLAPVVPRPSKVVCVGLNYRNHILEMGRELPEYPTLFAKYPEALIGPYDVIELPAESGQVDWEAELAIVIGRKARRVSVDEATDYIAGYAVLNDVTMRDYQYRTPQWFQGKTWENSTPFGPYLTTADEFELGGVLRGQVSGRTVQEVPTSDLVFDPATLVSYISTIFTLNPGDVIATGTPGGVGHARKPAEYLKDGDVLVTSVEGLGELENPVRGADASHGAGA